MRLKAIRASSSVLTLLPRRAIDGEVHSAYRRTVNLLCGRDVWISLHPASVPLHAYSIIVDARGGFDGRAGGCFGVREGFLGACRGENARVSRSFVEIGEGRAYIDLSDVALWESGMKPRSSAARPSNPTPDRHTDSSSYACAAGLLRQLACEQRVRSIFLAAVLNRRIPDEDSAVYRTLSRTIEDILDGIATSWTTQALGSLHAELRRAVGLGQGLTPSGDDFLVGFLGASRFLSGADEVAEMLFASLADHFCKTTRPSFFMLKAARDGRYPEPLADLLSSLTEGDLGGLERASGRLSPLGATSGQDMLAGLLFYLQVSGMRERAHEENTD